MSELEKIHNLQEILEKIRSAITDLDSNVVKLQEIINSGAFIPDTLSSTIRDTLEKIDINQKEFGFQYEILEIGALPEKLMQVQYKLEEKCKSIEGKKSYMDALSFFMRLHSDDAAIEAILENRKRYIKALNLEQLSVEELKEKAEYYIWLYNAYHEDDPKKKFSQIYKLASYFEVEIAEAIHFNTLIEKDEKETPEVLVQERPLAIEEKQPTDLWKELQIMNPEDLIVKERMELLYVETSVKADNKFGVKEFKRDVAGYGMVEKLDCMMEAWDGYGYSISSIAVWRNKPENSYKVATEKLLRQGYLKRYNVADMGEFFTLSSRGEKAFTSKEALSFINGYSKQKRSYSVSGKRIEDRANSAITRLLCFSTFKKVLQISPAYAFRLKNLTFGNEYFFHRFPEVIGECAILFVGIASENPEEFGEMVKRLKDVRTEADWVVAVGITQAQAKKLAKWLRYTLAGDEGNFFGGYCGYADDEVIDLKTGVCIVKESSEKEMPKEMRNDLTDEDDLVDEDDLAEDLEEQGMIDLASEEGEDNGEIKSITPSKVSNMPALTEEEKKKYNTDYLDMLATGQFCCATAYVKAISNTYPCYEAVYRQLAYALNDPMENCSYSSDTIFNVYFNEADFVSEHYVVAAAIRNYFMDQYSYDYSLQQLQSVLVGNSVLNKNPFLDSIVYTLQQFKTKYHSGIDKYADYREKERRYWEKSMEETKREARGYYDNYSAGSLKENASHKRFIETEKLLLGQGSELSEYLTVVMNDDRDMIELLEEFLAQNYVKDHAVICKENIDEVKINCILDKYWELAAQNMRVAKKTSDLMSSLRMNLFKRVSKVVRVLCDYVSLMKSVSASDDDPGLCAYKKLHTPLLTKIEKAMVCLHEEMKDADLAVKAGNSVLLATLSELKDRLIGTYKDGDHKFFYISFLKNDKVLLDEDYLPVLEEVLELPEFSVRNRILQHYKGEHLTLEGRLKEIFDGEDDYGSARLILRYFEFQGIKPKEMTISELDLAEAMVFPQKDMENKRIEFIEDLELAQSYGKIDNTVENSKEIMIEIMDAWYLWAIDSKNFGFFGKIISAFKNKIREDAQARAVELEKNLEVYLDSNLKWREDKAIHDAVMQIRERIGQQNYAAAEDLLNRLMENDLDLDIDLRQTDYLEQFLEEYDINYRKTANTAITLRSLVNTSKFNKDIKGANKLLESWPKGARVGEMALRVLLNALGFNVDKVKTEEPIQGKLESYLVTLSRPKNGRKSNYKHPIAVFGSEAEEKGFRVVCIFGKTDAGRLVDTFREIGNAKHTLVLLDYALTLADRRTLARKTKTDLSGKVFAVIDRVVLVYLSKHYAETAVNRMLMSVVMPFASYQPYIDKSADVMPQEIFIGRKSELEKIESPTGVNIVYGGRQLGKTALLRMAKKDIDKNENGDRAIIVDVWGRDYRAAARTISAALYDEKIVKKENITEDWNELARDIKNRLRDKTEPIPYLLLMIDEADVFIESCESVGYQPFEALKDIQSIGDGRFKFVVAGLRNIVRFKKTVALGNNCVLPHLKSLTVKPFKSMEARELLEVPLSYLGFRFPKDNETEVLISTIFGTTNYFPGLIQLYCAKLIEAVRRDYAGYSESETPPYVVRKEHIKKVLAEQSLQQDIREKFFITLKVGEDDYYYIIALLVAYHYHKNKSQNGCSAADLIELARMLEIGKLSDMGTEKISAFMEEMRELNVLQHIGDGRYRFARHSFCQMMGTVQQIDDELLKYMEE